MTEQKSRTGNRNRDKVPEMTGDGETGCKRASMDCTCKDINATVIPEMTA